MASIDHERKRISAAILLYGPPGAGKTTSLYALARQLPSGTHGKVAPLHQGDGRLLRLDYRPHDQDMVYGYQVNFRLVACPGSIEVDLLRPVLGAVDAILFVADSSKTALKANVKALELLDRMMRPTGKALGDVPMVFLYNKRDLREAVEIRLLEDKLNRYGCSYIAASAVRGQGVLDGLQRLTASVAVQVRQQVQAQGGQGSKGGNAKTVAHGTTFQDARALHEEAGGDDHTAISPARAPGARFDGDDDKTEINRGGGDWGADVADPGDLTAPSRELLDEASGGDWTRPSPGGGGRSSSSFAATSGVSFSELRPLEPDPAPKPPPARRPERAPPQPPAQPLRSAESWRTPQHFAEDVDSDDHTMPYRDRADFSEAGPDDITQTELGKGQTSPGSREPGRVQIAAAAIAPQVAQRAPAPRAAPQRAAPQRAAPQRAARPAPARAPAAAQARRIDVPQRRPPSVQPVTPSAPPSRAPAGAGGVAPAQGGGAVDFTATQVINSLGRQPEAWESQIEASAHRMKIPVPDLAGYVVSRIGTPKASTRRTVQVPVRATHMDTLMPQDFVLDIEFRGAGGARAQPAVSARTSSQDEGKTVPMSWMVGAFGVFAVTIAVIIALFMTKLG